MEMGKIKHKVFGLGEVVGREVKGNSTYITVRFEDDRQIRFAIPESFISGVVEAEGSLKDEVEKAIAERKARDMAKAESKKASSAPSAAGKGLKNHSKNGLKMILPIAEAYQEYLAQAGYKVETDDGSPSTVYVYAKAVESVASEEGMSWNALRDRVSTIIKKYDVGGAKQDFGCKSNKTVINALKRFEEFVSTP